MSTDQSTVEYREIKDFPGYRVGDDGSVWSAWKHCGAKTRELSSHWKRLKSTASARGYAVVTLSKNKKPQMFFVHRLVLEAFVGKRPTGYQCCHFPDRDTLNNSLANIRWDTPKTNCSERRIHGTAARGEKVHTAKLTEAKATAAWNEVLVARSANGKSPRGTIPAIAAKYGVSVHAIDQLVNGRTWKHITCRAV